jgi:ribosomal protein S18 acetylase RimI-like enzyme
MEIINADESHISEIVGLWIEFMDFHRDCDPLFTRAADAHLRFEEYVKDLMTKDTTQILVAVDRGEVIAYSISWIAERPPVFQDRVLGFISDLGVKSTRRRKGIGTQMLERILNWFESQGIHRIDLRVAAKNRAALSFWHRRGFRPSAHTMYLRH